MRRLLIIFGALAGTFLHDAIKVEAAEFKIVSSVDDLSSLEFGLPKTEISIALEGAIEKGDQAKLRLVIEQFSARKKREVCAKVRTRQPGETCQLVLETNLFLNSVGGNFTEGLKLANLVAEYKIQTIIRPNQRCYSSCGFVFLAGQRDISGEAPEGAIGDPKRFLYPTSSLRLHSPFIELGEDVYSEETVANAYIAAVQDIAEVVNMSKHWNLEPELLPPFLSKTKNAYYEIDTVERAVRFGIALLIPGYQVRSITPPMAKNYCNHMFAAKEKRFSTEIARPGREVIGSPNSSKDDFSSQLRNTMFESRKFKKSTDGKTVDETIILVPLHVDYFEEFPAITVCVVSTHYLNGFSVLGMQYERRRQRWN